MITYEANLICEKCGDSVVTGEPALIPDNAKQNAYTIAGRKGWEMRDFKPLLNAWLCPDCLAKATQSTTGAHT